MSAKAISGADTRNLEKKEVVKELIITFKLMFLNQLTLGYILDLGVGDQKLDRQLRITSNIIQFIDLCLFWI